jgi:hypothetical protein
MSPQSGEAGVVAIALRRMRAIDAWVVIADELTHERCMAEP